MTEKELDLIRQGKTPISFDSHGLPVATHEPVFELMRFVSALAKGYMRLYQSEKIHERCRGKKL